MNEKSIVKDIYINEIIRVNYKCNWSCKFCNVLKTNNYGDNDISSKEVTYKILILAKKYSLEERKTIILSFSGGEPTLNKQLLSFIQLAKSIGVGFVQIQTNGTRLFKEKEYINLLIDSGLDEVFLAQHSNNKDINSKLGIYYQIEDFISWIDYITVNNIHKKVTIALNIVVNKININSVETYLFFLKEKGFLNLLNSDKHDGMTDSKKISFGLVQPNGYAEVNKEEVLLNYGFDQVNEIKKIITFCEKEKIYVDLHYTAPPLCILDFPEYNLEYQRLKTLKEDEEKGLVNVGNLESYKYLWKEKVKLNECKKCINNDRCLGFYKNWLTFVGEKYITKKINNFITLNNKHVLQKVK